MPRALAILKYVPAVLCGLLVVAWVASQWKECTVGIRSGDHYFEASVAAGCFHCRDVSPALQTLTHLYTEPLTRRSLFGELRYKPPSLNPFFAEREIWIPILAILAIAFPFSAAPFTSFRFPLWSYFAWTALVAAELAYYLR